MQTQPNHRYRLARLLAFLACTLGLSSALAQTQLTDIIENTLTCALVQPLLADMPINPLYVQDQGECLPRTPDESSQNYYSDADCSKSIDFSATPLLEHCELLLDPDLLGEGENLVPDAWTLSPGSRLNLGARTLDGVLQPYLQRRIYRTVDTPGGSCSLEMRIYAPETEPSESERPAMLAFHGGSWSSRGFGFFGLEMSIPHFVDQGFVVYAPFYRLLGDTESSDACNQSDISLIIDDASAALAWVQANAADYGSSTRPVVFGQSAGAHLATALAVNEAQSVSSAVLFYPPTDFADFVTRAQQGYYSDSQGLAILERVLGTELAQADISASPIPENSFPQRIVESNLSVPPMIMVHGLQDKLVEARQSVRLCDALAGRDLPGPGVEIEASAALRSVLSCGDTSELHLILEGQHALDVCITDTVLATDLCLSGSDHSREEVSLAIADTVAFALAHSANDDSGDNSDEVDSDDGSDGADSSDGDESSSGGGAFNWPWLALLIAALLQRRRRAASREQGSGSSP